MRIGDPPEQRGFGVSWWEQVLLWTGTTVSAAVIGKFVDVFIEWARNRQRESPDYPGSPPPQVLKIYGPDGKVVRSVALTEGGETQVKDGDDD